MTVRNQYFASFRSNDDKFIWINGMDISNDRNNEDSARLSTPDWMDMQIGSDGYP